MFEEAIAVFTREPLDDILQHGRSHAWALNPNRARTSRYLVCIQNHPYNKDVFLVGKISDVTPEGDRWQICISEYACHTVENAWGGWRNPVRYTTLREMGIDLNELTFRSIADEQRNQSITTDQQAPAVAPRRQDDGPIAPLSIAQAKAGLALYYKVSQEAIEIVIRG